MSLVELEHVRLHEELLGDINQNIPRAALWWRKPITWSAELQRRTPFRQSLPDEPFLLYMEDEYDTPLFRQRNDRGETGKVSDIIKEQKVTFSEGVLPWLDMDYRTVMLQLAERMDIALTTACERFGEIRLIKSTDDAVYDWLYHPFLGVFKEFK